MELDFNALLNTMQLEALEKENPCVGKAVRIIMTKTGFSVTEALALLLEIGEILSEDQKNENRG